MLRFSLYQEQAVNRWEFPADQFVRYKFVYLFARLSLSSTGYFFIFSWIEQNRIVQAIGQVKFVVFEKFTIAYLNQTAWEIMLLPINVWEKIITEGSVWWEFNSSHVIFNLHSCDMKNAPVFSQLDVHNFFYVYHSRSKIDSYSLLWEALVEVCVQ